MLKLYASRTGTAANVQALAAAGWGFIVSAYGRHSHRSNKAGVALRFIGDNGEWSRYRLAALGDPEGTSLRRCLKFGRLLRRLGGSEFCDGWVAPDLIGGGLRSLELSVRWLPRLLDAGPVVYLPVQNGMREQDLAPFLSARVGIFVGGDTAWKLRTMGAWARLAHRHGAVCHVGRVNSQARIRACLAAGVDSCDGSSASRYAKTLPALDEASRDATTLDLGALFGVEYGAAAETRRLAGAPRGVVI